MKIEIEIPEEFEVDFEKDKFKDSLERIMADIRYNLAKGAQLSGMYEYEIIEMFVKAFDKSKPAYDIDKVVEELEKNSVLRANYKAFYNNPQKEKYLDTVVLLNDAIEIVKAGDKNE